MRNYFKLAMAGAVLGAGLLAQSAYADTQLPDTANGELVLYATYSVTVGTTTTVYSYARGTGTTIDAIDGGTKTALAADSSYVAGKALGMSFGDLTHDQNMTDFLAAANTAGAQVSFAVIGGDNTNLPTNRAPGSIRYGVTGVNINVNSTGITNNLLAGSWNNVESMQIGVNLAINSGTALDKTSTAGGLGQFEQGAYVGASNMFATNFNDTAALGSGISFYELTGGNGLGTGVARIYTVGTFTLSSAGDLSFQSAAAVPLPAAIWLLGSGLLGLAGVGRRKAA